MFRPILREITFGKCIYAVKLTENSEIIRQDDGKLSHICEVLYYVHMYSV